MKRQDDYLVLYPCKVCCFRGALEGSPPLQKEESPHNYSGGDITNTIDCSIIADTLQNVLDWLKRHIGSGLSGV